MTATTIPAIIGSIVVAVIALVGTLAGSYMANNKTQALLNYRMDAIEKKVDKSSDSTEELKEDVTILKRDMKTAFNQIGEIREDVRDIKKKEN